ncbi:hypothetical protein WNY59_00970 [Ahrensia kielensis]|uniref:DUF2946 domain-containing protein n=1 Tax=Ahrensia kielensis TaxID=76980 RepID=A0ABU9T1Z4_9HYPH
MPRYDFDQSYRLKNTFLPLKLLLVAALILASFAHTAFSRETVAPSGYDARAFSAQFVLPDGTLPVLCEQSGDGTPHHSSPVPCEFCSIAGAALSIGSLADSVFYRFATALEIKMPEATDNLFRPLYRTFAQSQAPPIV